MAFTSAERGALPPERRAGAATDARRPGLAPPPRPDDRVLVAAEIEGVDYIRAVHAVMRTKTAASCSACTPQGSRGWHAATFFTNSRDEIDNESAGRSCGQQA